MYDNIVNGQTKNADATVIRCGRYPNSRCDHLDKVNVFQSLRKQIQFNYKGNRENRYISGIFLQIMNHVYEIGNNKLSSPQ